MKPVKAPLFFERKRMLGIVVGLMAIWATVACADLQDIDAAVVQGILQNVDSISGEVTVQFKDGTTMTFNLEDVDIEALQAIAGSAVLQPGDEVELTLDEDDSVTTLAPSSQRQRELSLVSISKRPPSPLPRKTGSSSRLPSHPRPAFRAKAPDHQPRS